MYVSMYLFIYLHFEIFEKIFLTILFLLIIEAEEALILQSFLKVPLMIGAGWESK